MALLRGPQAAACPIGLRPRQQRAKPGERRADVLPFHHHVDHAMRFEIFGALKTFRQAFANCLFDHPGASKTDDRAGFGDMDIAEHGIRRRDAARRRIGQDDDIGKLGVAQTLYSDRRARHLHQREDAFLHPRSARGGEHDEWRAALDRRRHPRHDGLARRHAKRAAEKIEILHRGDYVDALQFAKGELHRVGRAGFQSIFFEPVRVALDIAEFQRVQRHFRRGDLFIRRVVEKIVQSCLGGDVACDSRSLARRRSSLRDPCEKRVRRTPGI